MLGGFSQVHIAAVLLKLLLQESCSFISGSESHFYCSLKNVTACSSSHVHLRLHV